MLEKIQMEKNFDCEEKSNEEILKKIQMEKNSDEGNSDWKNSSQEKTFFYIYYQTHKDKLQKKHVKDINIFLKKKRTKGEKNSEIDIEIFPLKKTKATLVYEKISFNT